MDREQIQSWLDEVQKELAALQIELAPLLQERAILEERRRLLEGLLSSLGSEEQGATHLTAVPDTPGGVVHGSVTTRVAEILREAGGPLHIDEILTRYEQKGYRVPGAGKPVNLIAHLRRSPLFVSAGRGVYDLAERHLDSLPIRPAASDGDE